MRYHWIDYSCAYKNIVESWLDEDAKRFTGCDDGFDAFYQYWENDPETSLGKNFWAKIILADDDPIGVIALGVWDGVFTIMEFIIRPDKRGKQFGSSALVELLMQSENIVGTKILSAEAVIFPNNTASQKAFEKACFSFHSAHPDGKAWYYRYHSSVCYCGHDCSKCVTFMATKQSDDRLRAESQRFYKAAFGLEIPLEKLACEGGRSSKVFDPCKECPFVRCCKEHAVASCDACPEYPCKDISDYREKYVNKCNQQENTP